MNYDLTTSTEEKLADIWRDIFGNIPISKESDFFELGGNSLTAIKLLSRVDEIFGQDILLPDTLFMNGQLGAVAAAIEAALQENTHGCPEGQLVS